MNQRRCHEEITHIRRGSCGSRRNRFRDLCACSPHRLHPRRQRRRLRRRGRAAMSRCTVTSSRSRPRETTSSCGSILRGFSGRVTASQAKLEDTGSSEVPNDNYVVEESHRLLTYLVPPTADITVLSRTGKLPGPGFPSTAITASQLAQLVDGKEPVKLAEPLEAVSGCTSRTTPSAPSSSSTARRPPRARPPL